MPGDVIFLKNPGSSTLVINSYEAAIELLDSRSQLYSSRPSMTMVTELCVSLRRMAIILKGAYLELKRRMELHGSFPTL